MAYDVTLIPSNKILSVNEDDYILDAALRDNIALEHSCGNGQCGACKAKVLEGEFSFIDHHQIMTHDEINNNIVLTCRTKAQSALLLEAEYYPELTGISKKTIPCKVAKIHFPVSDVAILTLRLPPTANFKYLPGQFVNLSIQGISRSYSLASSCVENNQFDLHIRNVDGGQISKIIFHELKEDQLLRLHGPHGTFFVREDARPLIFMAGGTGFAPVKAMVESLIAHGDQRTIHIYWGQRTAAGIYSNLINHWAQQYKNIQAHIIVSDDGTWSGRTGLVHEAILQDFTSLEGYVIYACGSPTMISTAKEAFIQQGMEDGAFHSDAFLPAVTS